MPIKANPWPIGYIGALSCSDNGCLVGIHLSCREDGLFRRVLPRYILKVSGPYDEFVTKDMIISVIVDNGSNLPPRPVPMELQIDWVFGTEGISDDEDEVPVPTEPLPYDISDTEAISDDEDEVGKSVRVKTDRGAREGFAVTIGWRLNRPCAHIEGFGKTAPPSQMLAGCSSSSKVHPREWAFKPLRKGVRVTVTATLDARRWTVSISVGRPKSAHRTSIQVADLGATLGSGRPESA
ncbi:hypothetical protein BV22DRAFT_326446 [Leucogyrophana mollusca]|uniref:Uncharacterized protein n=1 Tax=Leucogyrophana mollusca TaxID=85980 RepID=A0ACB8BNL9_9AGAM|nr:hypothetical protein BV22DRAFT_326446 [Leucogyrophana mollusca]